MQSKATANVVMAMITIPLHKLWRQRNCYINVFNKNKYKLYLQLCCALTLNFHIDCYAKLIYLYKSSLSSQDKKWSKFGNNSNKSNCCSHFTKKILYIKVWQTYLRKIKTKPKLHTSNDLLIFRYLLILYAVCVITNLHRWCYRWNMCNDFYKHVIFTFITYSCIL